MAMDNELRKILLREQDLRFVTDTLGQYLGKRAEERKYYADQSHKERIEAEKARVAGLGEDKPPEMEKFYYNVAPVEDWSDDFKTYVAERGLNIKGGETNKLFDISDKDSAIFQSYPELTLVPTPSAASTPKPTKKYVSITAEHWTNPNIAKFLLSIGYKQGAVIDTAEERNLSTEEILAGEKVGFRFVDKPTSTTTKGDNKDITYNLTSAHMENPAILEILNQHALIPSDFTGSKKLNLSKDVITELQKLGLTGEIKAPPVQEMYFTMPEKLNDEQRALLITHGFKPDATSGTALDGLFSNENIREFKKIFDTSFLSTQKPEGFSNNKNKLINLINSRTKIVVDYRHKEYIESIRELVNSLTDIDDDTYKMLRSDIGGKYDDTKYKMISKVYANMITENKDKSRAIVSEYRSGILSGSFSVESILEDMDGSKKQKLIDLNVNRTKYLYLQDNPNLKIASFGSEYKNDGVIKKLSEHFGVADWENFKAAGVTNMDATGTNIAWATFYKLVKDNRTSVEKTDVQSVMDGGINEFIKAYLMSQ